MPISNKTRNIAPGDTVYGYNDVPPRATCANPSICIDAEPTVTVTAPQQSSSEAVEAAVDAEAHSTGLLSAAALEALRPVVPAGPREESINENIANLRQQITANAAVLCPMRVKRHRDSFFSRYRKYPPDDDAFGVIIEEQKFQGFIAYITVKESPDTTEAFTIRTNWSGQLKLSTWDAYESLLEFTMQKLQGEGKGKGKGRTGAY